MDSEDRMDFSERRKYLRIMRKRYKEASRRERSNLLDEMEAVTGLHRKSLIRLLGSPIQVKRKARRRERGPVYGPEVREAIGLIARALDYPAAERLQPRLVFLANHLARHGEMEVSDALLEKLEGISVSTVRRILSTLSRDKPRPPVRNRGRKRALLQTIPIDRIPWNVQEPGHLEVDLVHHCGPTASGEYVCTVQMVDVATGWVEQWAVLGRSYRVMEDAFSHILARIPFPIQELHSDNGSELLNWHLIRFLRRNLPGVRLSRSRPYHKNDNRFVEQRNASLVRAYIGYDRLDTVEQTNLLNLIYEKLWVYHNLFQPVRRTREKILLPSDGQTPRVKRVYDQARTPLERLETSGVVEPQRLEALRRLRDETNPLHLREEIYDLIDQLFSLPGATPGVTEDVHKTLNLPFHLPEEVISPVTLSFD